MEEILRKQHLIYVFNKEKNKNQKEEEEPNPEEKEEAQILCENGVFHSISMCVYEPM